MVHLLVLFLKAALPQASYYPSKYFFLKCEGELRIIALIRGKHLYDTTDPLHARTAEPVTSVPG